MISLEGGSDPDRGVLFGLDVDVEPVFAEDALTADFLPCEGYLVTASVLNKLETRLVL